MIENLNPYNLNLKLYTMLQIIAYIAIQAKKCILYCIAIDIGINDTGLDSTWYKIFNSFWLIALN